MIQDGCLEVEHSFLIRFRFRCSSRVSGIFLCGIVTPRSLTFRTHWMLRWSLLSWLPWTLSPTLNCSSFFELNVRGPSYLEFCAGSFWTVVSPSAEVAWGSLLHCQKSWLGCRCWMLGIYRFSVFTRSMGWFTILACPILSQDKHVPLYYRIPVFNGGRLSYVFSIKPPMSNALKINTPHVRTAAFCKRPHNLSCKYHCPSWPPIGL